jgi:lipoprotein-releasing system ATP-binding protein
MNDSESALDLCAVAKSFQQGGVVLRVLRQIDLQIQPGESVALLGPSGSGKSTLLHIAALLERPDAGAVRVCGTDCSGMSDGARTLVRRDRLGMVYQFHHLMPEFSALENVMMPMLIKRQGKDAARRRAYELLQSFGLGERLEHQPARLSGGEQQRVAIARAIANQPAILLADEPTGNLDQQTADTVFNNLVELVRQHELAALIATHNFNMAKRMDRVVTLQDGVLVTV